MDLKSEFDYYSLKLITISSTSESQEFVHLVQETFLVEKTSRLKNSGMNLNSLSNLDFYNDSSRSLSYPSLLLHSHPVKFQFKRRIYSWERFNILLETLRVY